jgi:hypothetical protein
MPKRTTSQIVLLVVWLIGLIGVIAIYQVALIRFRFDVATLYPGPGIAPADWSPPSDWEKMIADKYEGPLAAIYTPWLLVMVGSLISSVQKNLAERISGIIFGFTLFLSVLFNASVCSLLWIFMFNARPLANSIPSNSPLIGLLISIIGAFVTYNFPEVKEVQEQKNELEPKGPPT